MKAGEPVILTSQDADGAFVQLQRDLLAHEPTREEGLEENFVQVCRPDHDVERWAMGVPARVGVTEVKSIVNNRVSDSGELRHGATS